MQYIKLIDKKEKKIRWNLTFSVKYLLFGPFYFFGIKFFVAGIMLIFLYYFFLPIYGLNQLFAILNIEGLMRDIFCFFRTSKGMTIGMPFIFVLHLVIAILCPRYILKKRIDKKELIPYSPNDKLLLIKTCGKNYRRVEHYLKYTPTLEFTIPKDSNKDEKVHYLDILLLRKKNQIEHYNDTLIQNMLQQVFEEYNLGLINYDEYIDYNEKILALKEK